MAPQFLRNWIPPKESKPSIRELFNIARSLTLLQWAFLFSGCIAWTSDAMDFHSVSLSVKNLSAQFDKSTTQVTTSITLTLLFRSLGALIFGLISDRYGRKWPLVWNLLFCCAFELATGFAQTFKQFLALRALFGLAMGGVWGIASSTALETLPVEIRGVASGIVQQGYSLGYILAAVVNLSLVPENPHGWRALFWTAAGISFFSAVVRMLLPESEFFLRARAAAKASGIDSKKRTEMFIHESGQMVKYHWKRAIYSVLLMTGFNFASHGSADLYPTFLQVTKHLSARDASVLTIIANCGAVAGGIICGSISQYAGRRLTIATCMVIVGAFVPLWILPKSFSALGAGGFCLLFGVHGAFGVIPIFLAEISPPAFRAVFPGLAYQLGNMISSASAQIEATVGDHEQILVNGKRVPNYGTVQGILIGVIAAFTFCMIVIGPENHGAHFEKHKAAFEAGGGKDDAYVGEEEDGGLGYDKRSPSPDAFTDEKSDEKIDEKV